MQSYSQDLRDRVLRALARGDGPSAIAERFGSAASTSIRCGIESNRPGCGAVFRSAAIAALGCKTRNRFYAAGLQPSRD